MTDFRDTWAFLDARVKDAFDLKKTIQEVALPFSVTLLELSFFTLLLCFSELRFVSAYNLMLKFCRQNTWRKLLEQEWEVLCKDLLREFFRDEC